MEITLLQGDCLEEMKKLEDNSVDSVVTDPPYGLAFMGKSWDDFSPKEYQEFCQEWGAEVLRVLKPGGNILSFSGTRTYHRMASGLEDAGFEVRDMIEWIYGSGFPKSLNISKVMEGVIGKQGKGFKSAGDDGRKAEFKQDLSKRSDYGYVWKPTSENAKQFEGWGTALKPAHEPICMARKPLAEKTVAENCLEWGTGGINIDDSRIGFNNYDKTVYIEKRVGYKDGFNHNQLNGKDETAGYKLDKNEGTKTPVFNQQGRFPANLIHDNSEEVRECFPESKSTGGTGKIGLDSDVNLGGGNNYYNFGDSGTAARYFKSIYYQAKANKAERNMGCEGLPLGEAPASARSKPAEGRENALGEPRANHHPTVKPIALMEYLIKMVTPPGGTVLDPFMGSGTTGIACKVADCGFIGIEKSEEYMQIAEARIDGADIEKLKEDINKRQIPKELSWLSNADGVGENTAFSIIDKYEGNFARIVQAIQDGTIKDVNGIGDKTLQGIRDSLGFEDKQGDLGLS